MRTTATQRRGTREHVYETTYHGTQWRVHIYHWNSGGIDGWMIRKDLEWRDTMWQTDESWMEEKHRPIPAGILEWKKHVLALFDLTEGKL